MNNKDIQKQLCYMYDVADYGANYNYWFNKLLAFCLNLFRYGNTSETLKPREIEANLILTGYSVIIPKNANLYAIQSQPYGFDEYINPDMATWANPILGSGNVKFGESAEIIYNSPLQYSILGRRTDGGLYTFIAHYASLLADTNSTSSIYAVNARAPYLPVSKSDSVTASIKKFFNMIRLGKRAIITDDYILDSVKSIDIGKGSGNDNMMSWLQATDKILEQFYRDIGIKFGNQKKENLTESEVNVNDQLRIISIDQMLQERKEGVERVNKLFGTDITVEINPILKEVEVNDNSGDTNKPSDGSTEDADI